MSTRALVHRIKSTCKSFHPMWNGDKNYEVLKADERSFTVGDKILFREWNEVERDFTHRELFVIITHVTKPHENGLTGTTYVIGFRQIVQLNDQ